VSLTQSRSKNSEREGGVAGEGDTGEDWDGTTRIIRATAARRGSISKGEGGVKDVERDTNELEGKLLHEEGLI
jgi:hypothetical protein